jgi:4-hydroxy 2-oxovalerate aldolase
MLSFAADSGASMQHPQLKVLDCTLRDGGLNNRWQFTDAFVRRVLLALSSAGVDCMEIGYRSSDRYVSRAENGRWRFCAEDDLRRLLEGIEPAITLSAMVDVGRVDPADIAPRRDSALQMIRVACYAHQVDQGILLARHCLDQGYETTVNLMAVSSIGESELDQALETLARSPVPTIYLVDSFGALYPEQVRGLMQRYSRALPGKELGIHAHNNLQLALANTIEAAGAGARLLDATLYGMGRGAGNCPLELLLSFLARSPYRLEPVIEVIQDLFIPLKHEVEWGYHLPHMITGALNVHPRSGTEAMAAETPPRLGELYTELAGRPRPKEEGRD